MYNRHRIDNIKPHAYIPWLDSRETNWFAGNSLHPDLWKPGIALYKAAPLLKLDQQTVETICVKSYYNRTNERPRFTVYITLTDTSVSALRKTIEAKNNPRIIVMNAVFDVFAYGRQVDKKYMYGDDNNLITITFQKPDFDQGLHLLHSITNSTILEPCEQGLNIRELQTYADGFYGLELFFPHNRN